MRTEASIFGQPLHAILIVVPLGAFPVSLVFDALHVWQPAGPWYLAAFVATVVGEIGLLLAIIPGFWDYARSIPKRGEIRSHVTVHMALGIALTGYFLASAAARWVTLPSPGTGVAWTALLFNAVGHAGLVGQAYLGGGLTYTHHVGVRTGYMQELPPPSAKGVLTPEQHGPARPARQRGTGGDARPPP